MNDSTDGRERRRELAGKDLPRVDRRTALRWMGAATAAIPVLEREALGAERSGTRRPRLPAGGYGPDPDLLRSYQPGDLWSLTLNDAQRRLVMVLCDLVMPADESSPSASSLGVHDFIDEWISSPYPGQVEDRRILLEGLAWIDVEAIRSEGEVFVSLPAEKQFKMCQALARRAKASSNTFPGSFFYRLRNLVAGAYYTTPEGMEDIGYRGNTPQDRWDGPPPEVLEKLNLPPQ